MKISKNEPILKAPSAIMFLIGLMVMIHITLTKILSPELGFSLFLKMAFVPADFSQGHKIWTIVSYAFLHASWEHLLMNMVWLLAFGSAVAKRMDNAKIYLMFFLICCVIAIQVQFFFSQETSIPIIGASGGVAAMLGAAARFAFSADILASSN
ncbi:MAG: rhomboid family intramembrane serine protease, partial [Pseudomonadota bacterium]|nr:rhomboid family intramembrane serine protease [Pseudomonadota bacterium]